MIDAISPLILTWNEEANIGRTLGKLGWAREVVVLDSGSTDRTREICASFPNVRFVVRPFDTHAQQWNFGLGEAGLSSSWVLALDADYVLTDELVEELGGLSPADPIMGYWVRFRYCVNGRQLSGSLYPPVVALFRKDRARYRQDGHTQRVEVDGELQELRSPILHDDRKPLGRWLAAQERYAQLECDHLLQRPSSELSLSDRIRKLVVFAPILAPIYCLTVGRGIFDGWPGLYYALQRASAEALLSLKLIEARVFRARRDS